MKMRKVLAIVLAVCMMVLCCTACGNKDDDKIKIGVMQFGEFTALQNAYNGFVDGLKAAGYVDGENITINYQSAAGEAANCPTIADTLINDDSDLILAIATPAIQAMKQKTDTIPLLFTAVTDAVEPGLVKSNEKPGGNITGTSDLTPCADQIKLLKEILPNAKTVAVMYCSSEANSAIQYKLAKAQIEKMGMTCIEKTITAIDEAKSAVESLKGVADAIYIPTDNTLADGMTTVATAANEQKIPIIGGEAGMVADGCLATIGIDYYTLGKQTAAMAVRIIKDGANPAEMPVEFQTGDLLKKAINTKTAEACGITLPESVTQDAIVYPSK